MKIHGTTLVLDYILRSPVCHAYPRRLVIESTAKCNLACKMCPRSYAMTRDKKDMTMHTFSKIIEDGRGKLEFVSLQGYGEPLLNPKIYDMISLARKNNISTGISTNATVLDQKNSTKLIASGLDYLIFAFDGATKKTYEDVRRGANYEKVIANIKGFLKAKNKKKTNTFVVCQCIYMVETENEIENFKKQWSVRGVDGLRIRQITQSIKRYDKKTQKKFSNNQSSPCYWLWTEPAVWWDGTVVPCCQDVNAQINLGNVNREDLFKIWNNQKMRNLRRLHAVGARKKIPLCRNCNMYQPNILLAAGSAFFPVYTINKLLPRIETLISSLRFRK